MSEPFDVIPFSDIQGDWKKLGAGSFGNVYKGNYLGIDVAIKEVLPSKEYDVAKYFEREWRLMKECRHPNICLFIGLSRAPDPDNRIFIISEFIENGNVRLYIHDKHKPFPWRLRLSFAIDVARALAYLHARKCIHRDLKGENLLVTSNGRIKVTDFGFARIAARNEEESKRLTFCGTDSYMSPEILLGDEFDLPTDVFSLGIILCEIASRKLADDTHFKRHPPEFGIDAAELRKLANPDCPSRFIDLCLDCLNTDPAKRPTTRMILERLREIEVEVLARPEEGEPDVHVGSIKFMSGGKRPGNAPRIPSFGMGIAKDIRNNGDASTSTMSNNSSEEESDEEELIEALSKLGINPDPNWNGESTVPLLDTTNTPTKKLDSSSSYSTSVVRSHLSHKNSTPSALNSVMTIRPSPDPTAIPPTLVSSSSSLSPVGSGPAPVLNDASTFSIDTLDSYYTAAGVASAVSSTFATEGGSSTVRTIDDTSSVGVNRSAGGSSNAGRVHRFTLIKPGTKPRKVSVGAGHAHTHAHGPGSVQSGIEGGGSAIGGFVWNPLDLFFSSGLLMAKCDVCFKRLGWRPVMACDDCGMKAHEKCGDVAPTDCGLRPARPAVHQSPSPLQAISPLSKVKKDAVQAAPKSKAKSHVVGVSVKQ